MPMIKTRTIERFDKDGNLIERETEEVKVVGNNTQTGIVINTSPHRLCSTIEFGEGALGTRIVQ